MKPIVERFFRYVGIDTQSTWEAETVPASSNEFVLGQMLVDELKALGIENAWMDDKSYVFAKIPSNQDHPVPPVAFFAHLDTAPDESGANVNPRIIENWDGTDIVLNEDKQIILSKEEFPSLQNSIGKDLIVTDGNSLLGADDKAGVAEIMDAAEYLCTHPEFPHGDVLICFTPDEEIGNSTEYIPIENIPAKYGYRMVGGVLGEMCIRDRKQRVQEIADHLNQYYGENTFCVEVDDYYFNMGKEVEKYPEVKDYALKAMEMAEVTPVILPIRGGTDGSSISFMGIPCPNIFMGSANSHSIYEYCTIQSMEKASEIIRNIIWLFAR